MRLLPLVSLAALVGRVLCDSAPSCGNGKNCPEDSPCCSQYGECGTGLYCLGACDVAHSFNSSACVPLPVCNSKEYQFTSSDMIADQTKYLGDNSKYGWTTNGQVLDYGGNVLLTMANQSYGTVISSTSAVWYGKVSATLKTSHGDGVVSAFIIMSPSKDEIDYEFVGSNVGQAQTNFYYEGILNYTNGASISLSSTNESFHTYEFDWSEDRIQWLIDGQVARTLNKADTYNSTTGQYMYPQTPGIVQLSLWPGGSELNGQGTVDWAGGPIDWNMPEFSDPGYLFVTLKDISVECYDPPSGATVSGNSSYVFTSNSNLTESSVQITDDKHILGSFAAVGYDLDKGKDDKNLQTVSAVTVSQLGGNDGDRSASGSVPVASQVKQTSTSDSSTKSLVNVSNVASSTSSSKAKASTTGASSDPSDTAAAASTAGTTTTGSVASSGTTATSDSLSKMEYLSTVMISLIGIFTAGYAFC
ncbi:Utr2p [Sugiyamaella lignohabitans]|uniref:Crh-like protein n=1 Tax=Sugiyamaella lignohabitans TaxID=796027 RepID=A0A161HIC8_9ASCO|nr:Utr2p [Sugiyamaella lignohabitans]ANB16040.1 Utr2p [Sugiyamaella lignohabitans]